jgi:pyruvate dehydrogenase E2 component (dihydrolipoyllysine-residue acetyltransferase)
MATKVHMEALSPTMEEGQLVRWLKSEGDEVGEGDILAEIETDKATMELVARGAGVLRKIGLGEGQTAKVGDVIAVIAPADEDIAGVVADIAGGGNGKPAAKEEAPSSDEVSGDRAEPEASAEAGSKPVKSETSAAQAGSRVVAVPDGDGRVKASPLARRLASEAGIELSGVEGSGPGGRIIKRDIEAAAQAPAAGAKRRDATGGPDSEDVPVSQMRKAIAKRLVTSIGPVPTFYLTVDLDMTRLLAAREEVNRRLEKSGVKTSINDYVTKALAMALARHPEVNASWGDSVITRHHRVHIAVAVAIEDGLITPIIRDADLKGVAEISAEVRELAGRAREKKLKPEEYTGSTFSISNLGMFGIEEFTAIINPPEAGILAVGQVEEKVVAENGEMVIRSRMRVTMSCDHRVVDGATGAKFLQTFRGFIEEPVMMLV